MMDPHVQSPSRVDPRKQALLEGRLSGRGKVWKTILSWKIEKIAVKKCRNNVIELLFDSYNLVFTILKYDSSRIVKKSEKKNNFKLQTPLLDHIKNCELVRLCMSLYQFWIINKLENEFKPNMHEVIYLNIILT